MLQLGGAFSRLASLAAILSCWPSATADDDKTMDYTHTQTGYWHYLLFAVAATVLAVAWSLRGDPVLQVAMPCAAGFLVLCGLLMSHLTVEDEGEYLAVRFGPLPLLRKRIAYDQIAQVQRGRSSWLDGWGVHYVPGRGTTYNIWGFDCVKITVGHRTIRIGTDDADNLLTFLQQKMRNIKAED